MENDRPNLAHLMPEPAKTASVGEVPEWLEPVKALLSRTQNYMCGAVRVSGTSEFRAVRALVAAHEPEPVDPLREAVEAACNKQFAEGGNVVEYLITELRQRGVTAGERG